MLAHIVALPFEMPDAAGINAYGEKALQDEKALAEVGDEYRRVAEHWRPSLVTAVDAGDQTGYREAELFAICVGDVVFLGANAEVFSEFRDWLRRGDRSITRKAAHKVGLD
jgi:hypothetical protein